ncbi:FAR-17a/AIG1-like protein [Suillus fuscotomentosus]|uniref:FAR-17a/AIG1-like protein n=1 Tax=Suillus fuscotomentosus TaxID=1912939 RepID=A0AAD4EH09_9AGAM|nr:FAR-17a/AIG1-like protein [Suillus fuscotomentosus]KAG1905975.1 FAR-17a/AIG1-like protein [Suillus fuscotomentosus]
MPRPEAFFLHGVAVGVMTYGFISLRMLPMDGWIRAQKGGHFQFLTIQGLATAWLTMVLSLGCDLLPSLTTLRTAKRASLMIALPLTFVISAVYWSLLLFFPSLILQRQLPGLSEPSSSIPFNIDFSLHLAPVITLLVDFIFFEKKYTKKQAQIGSPLVVLACGAWYSWWVEYCASYNHTFPYPFLTENPFNIRVGIYAFVSFLAWSCFRLMNALHP